MRTRAALAALLLAGFSLAPSIATAAGPKLGVVDVKRVMEAVPAWGKAVEKLKAEWDEKQKLLQNEQDSLRKQKEQIDAKRTVSDPKTLAKEQATLLEKAQRLADSFLIQQQLISRQELELKSQMLARIEPIVNALASEGDYAYIFETGSPDAPNIVYATPKIDISDAVIEQYKKRFKDKPFEVPSAEQIAKQIEKLAGAAKDLE